MKQKSLLVITICIISLNLSAQFNGVIVDDTYSPIEDAGIYNISKSIHTHTDVFGRFNDNNSQIGDTIEIRKLGYKSVQLVLNQTNINDFRISLENSYIILDQINVTEPVEDNIQKIDIRKNPVANSQELLRKVPGLFIAQHAGGGKAEQMFLRGFDIDHGTDINLTVDNYIPVNMPSHAHGQGYADLHFVIPEMIQAIEFEKGSFNSAKGNFATAGSVNFKLKDRINQSQISFEKGMFNFNRAIALINLSNGQRLNSYLAGEYITNNGYFKSPQDFNKLNLAWKFNYSINSNSGLALTASTFTSHWFASGQIPEREILAGRLNWFGAIDDTEGGKTNRSNVLLQYYIGKNKIKNIKINAYFSNYNFNLFSNFTFFLNDSTHGDQINQIENRNILGLESKFENQFKSINYQAGLGIRSDFIKNSQLNHTSNRLELIERFAYGDIQENNIYGFVKSEWDYKKFQIQAQFRSDFFDVNYLDKLKSKFLTNRKEIILSPKLNLSFQLNKDLQIYFKNGLGFHSNDTRLIAQDPSKGLLTRSTNSDLGIQWKPWNNTFIHSGLWVIDLEDELVYVGDEAVVESSGHTFRKGIELGLRTELNRFFDLFADASYTIARIVELPEGENYIPLASKWTALGGINFQDYNNFSGTLRIRYLGDRPANEEYSLIAKGYTVCDASLNYSVNNITFSSIVDNIFNVRWKEAQFATLSRLQNEKSPVEEIHFTPGSPFNFRLKVLVKF
ncbi:MAG: TonB-dependent receptor plug domain-containing protein [Saprospiraceae bacterium]|nr:TonB-dependent receptor plug domain-containing protein [Saprospiraceae bacterium]